MPLPYSQNKKHIYKWRESNLTKLREINRISKAKCDRWKKVKKEFLLILIDI